MCKRPHCAHVFCLYRCMFPVGARKIWMVVNDLFIPIPRGLFGHLFIWRTFLVCCVWRSTCPHNFCLSVLKAHFSSHSPSWFSMQLQGNERRDLTGHMRHHGLEWAASALWDFSWRLLTFSLLRVVEIFHLGCLVVIYLPDCNAQPRLWTAVLCFTITQVNHTRHTKVAWVKEVREQYKDKKTMKDDAF